MRAIAEEVCREMIQNVRNELNAKQTAPHGTALELEELPEPETDSGKGKRVYLKLAATVDIVLADRLIAMAKQEKSSIGLMLDRVLREVFDKPLLSYQLPPEELKPLEEKHKAALAKLNRRKRKQDA